MIWTVILVSLRRLLHNRVELILTFAVPIAFFSVFAMIFGGGVGSGKTPKIKVIAVDLVDSPQSNVIVASLRDNAGLRFMRSEQDVALTRDDAEKMVRDGSATLAIVVDQSEPSGLLVKLLSDSSDQVASQIVSAFVTKAIMVSHQKTPATANRNPNRTPADGVQQASATEPIASSATPNIEIVDVMGEGKTNPVVSMYAAGIAVMFLLFGATGGGGALLEERENQTLDRLLSTGLTMDQLLLGKWFYLTLLGILQVSVMFLWGQFMFGVDLLGHLDGFFMMTLVTAGAAAAFGLFLATLCKTRGQLNGLSVILILTMSALGGSMVPRYVMSQNLRDAGMWTFNAWALDGYDKVFWRDLPASEITPQIMVLLASGAVFLVMARMLAYRWEFD